MKKISKAERVVVIGGSLIIITLLVLGLIKTKVFDSKKEPFAVQDSSETESSKDNDASNESTDTIKGIAVKEDLFVVEAGSELDESAATYLEADASVLKNVSMKFNNVDLKKPGKYKATATYDGNSIEIAIQVKDTTAPKIIVDNEQVLFTLEPNSTLEELIKFVNARGEDLVDGTITEVTGWPKALPTEAATMVYTLQMKDAAGNIAKKDITVQYALATA